MVHARLLSHIRSWRYALLRLNLLQRTALLIREAEMEKFVHNENLELYRKLLAEMTDAQKRQMLLKPLADEEARDEQAAQKKLG